MFSHTHSRSRINGHGKVVLALLTYLRWTKLLCCTTSICFAGLYNQVYIYITAASQKPFRQF